MLKASNIALLGLPLKSELGSQPRSRGIPATVGARETDLPDTASHREPVARDRDVAYRRGGEHLRLFGVQQLRSLEQTPGLPGPGVLRCGMDARSGCTSSGYLGRNEDRHRARGIHTSTHDALLPRSQRGTDKVRARHDQRQH